MDVLLVRGDTYQGGSVKLFTGIYSYIYHFNQQLLMTFKSEIPTQYQRAVKTVTHHIQNHLSSNLSLQDLSAIANYSPFHFQKIFKQVTGESPKEYITRVRLETAAHAVIIQPQKSIKEIAAENGFTSAAAFSRAFKAYFGITADEMRTMPDEKRLKLYKEGVSGGQPLLQADVYFGEKKSLSVNQPLQPDINIKRISEMNGIFIDTVLDSAAAIEAAFKKLHQLAESYNLQLKPGRFMGVIYPHQRLYKAMFSINENVKLPGSLLSFKIPAGTYATYKLTGGLDDTFQSLKRFTQEWLPQHGYQLADTFGFEVFTSNPSQGYQLAEKEINIPVVLS